MENKSIDLSKLTKNQLINIILNLGSNNSKSEIRFFDIRVSSNESLLSCEESLNRIIERHKSFLEYKKTSSNMLTGYRGEIEDEI